MPHARVPGYRAEREVGERGAHHDLPSPAPFIPPSYLLLAPGAHIWPVPCPFNSWGGGGDHHWPRISATAVPATRDPRGMPAGVTKGPGTLYTTAAPRYQVSGPLSEKHVWRGGGRPGPQEVAHEGSDGASSRISDCLLQIRLSNQATHPNPGPTDTVPLGSAPRPAPFLPSTSQCNYSI